MSIRPRESGGGGPRVCAVEGASDSTLRCRCGGIVAARAPPTAGLSPILNIGDHTTALQMPPLI